MLSIGESLRAGTRNLLRRVGFDLVRSGVAPDMDSAFTQVCEICAPFTQTSVAAMYGLYKAVQYIESTGVEGDLVECGVWRGGSSMLAAMTLLQLGSRGRQLYLYDTFEGMPEPSERDVDMRGRSARPIWARTRIGQSSAWCRADHDEVRRNMTLTGYPSDRMVMVPGRVEETIPGVMPSRIALLRLDTDWYESTYHELKHLVPRLRVGGVLIIDDYGYWRGAREAADQYLRETGLAMLLTRLDPTVRLGVRSR